MPRSPPAFAGRAAIACAAAFVLLAALKLGGALEGMDAIGDAWLDDGLHAVVPRVAVCQDDLCRDGDYLYRSGQPRNGTWEHPYTTRHSLLPFAGQVLPLGSAPAAAGIMIAALVLLGALGAWRAATLAAATAILGSLLIQPLKFGGWWAPYPSGHTIGATLMLGLALMLPLATLEGRIALPRHAWRLAIGAWGVVALLVGFDLVHSGYHDASDILLGWTFGAALVAAAVHANQARARGQASLPA